MTEVGEGEREGRHLYIEATSGGLRVLPPPTSTDLVHLVDVDGTGGEEKEVSKA